MYIYILLSDDESPRFVRYVEVGHVMKPRHPTSIKKTVI